MTMTRLGTPIWIGGQADAGGVVHGLQHVIHQRAQLIIDLLDGLRDLLAGRGSGTTRMSRIAIRTQVGRDLAVKVGATRVVPSSVGLGVVDG